MAWELLFGSDIGLMSVFTIVFILGMAIFFARFYSKRMDEDGKRDKD